MKLIEKIRADRIIAFKAKENIKKNLLGCLIADSCKEDKEPDDIKVLAMIKKFIEGAELVIKNSKDGDFEHYKASMEIDILKTYRPCQLSEEDIRGLVNLCIAEGYDLGKTMKHFKDKFNNQYDAALVSKIAKETL